MDDLISRQAAIDAIVNTPSEVQNKNIPLVNQYDGATFRQIEILGIIEALPSAQPERKKGQWMKEDRGHVEYCAVCDQCGFDWIWSDREYFKFCPNCGADMRGEQDG